MISMINKFLLRHKLSVIVPAMLIVTGILVNGFLVYTDYIVTRNIFIERYLMDNARIILKNIQQQVEYFYNSGNTEQIDKTIKSLSANEYIERIDLINLHGIIIFSSKNENIQKYIDVENQTKGCILKKDQIRCFQPLLINDFESGFLSISYNLKHFYSSLLTSFLFIYSIHILVIIVASLILLKFLNNLITKNLNQLSSHLDKVVQGKYVENLYIEGSNEFSFIADKVNRTTKRLWELINIDYLTRIPNRFYLVKTFGEIKGEQKNNLYMGLIDIDNFKEINDFFGHNVGDYLLMELAERLKTFALKHKIEFGRLGGDEFLIIGRFDSQMELDNSIREMKENLEGFYSLINSEIKISISMGIHLLAEEDNFYDAMKKCDIALYKAKTMGKGKIMYFTEDLAVNEMRQKEILNYITGATERKEFYLVFQPIFDIKNGEIYAYEALLRWYNHKLGNVSPGEFIPMIEKTGLIVDVGKYVLREAIQSQKKLGKPVHVNVSLIQLYDRTIVDFVKEECNNNGVFIGNIVIELIETQEIFKHKAITDTLNYFKFSGFEISLDDFGTGFSNIELLDKIDPDSIKIDMVLTKEVVDDVAKRHIILSILRMAEVLDIKVIAEGVDSEEKLEVLEELGVRYMQGFHLGKPERLE